MAGRTPSNRAGGSTADDRGERVRALVRNRADVLESLLEEPRTKPSLVAALGSSRSTVDRALKALTAQGLVRLTEGKYVASSAGRLAYDATERHRDVIADIERTAPMLQHLSAETCLTRDVLAEATIHRPVAGAGRQALRAAMSVVKGADTVYACSQAVTDTAAPTAAYRLVVEAEATLEVVYASHVADYIRDEHAGDRREMVSTGRYRAFETASLPFGLFVAHADDGTQVAVAVYDASNALVGVLTNDTDAAVAWAESVYRQQRASATEFTDEFSSGNA